MTQLMQRQVTTDGAAGSSSPRPLLAVPALAMAFQIGVPDPGQGTDGVNWGPMDFAIMGVLILGSGLLFEYAARAAGASRTRPPSASPSWLGWASSGSISRSA